MLLNYWLKQTYQVFRTQATGFFLMLVSRSIIGLSCIQKSLMSHESHWFLAGTLVFLQERMISDACKTHVFSGQLNAEITHIWRRTLFLRSNLFLYHTCSEIVISIRLIKFQLISAWLDKVCSNKPFSKPKHAQFGMTNRMWSEHLPDI